MNWEKDIHSFNSNTSLCPLKILLNNIYNHITSTNTHCHPNITFWSCVGFLDHRWAFAARSKGAHSVLQRQRKEERGLPLNISRVDRLVSWLICNCSEIHSSFINPIYHPHLYNCTAPAIGYANRGAAAIELFPPIIVVVPAHKLATSLQLSPQRQGEVN